MACIDPPNAVVGTGIFSYDAPTYHYDREKWELEAKKAVELFHF
jgi:hypothetical protein